VSPSEPKLTSCNVHDITGYDEPGMKRISGILGVD
jgi:hypothetical protein